MINIVKRLDQFDNNYIYYYDAIKNNVINEGSFIRIIYSTPYFSLNGIHLYTSFNNIIIEKYYNKNKCFFNVTDNKEIIDNIKNIEEDLLKNVNIKNKIPEYKIYDQIKNGQIKLFKEIDYNKNILEFILKISGVWITESNYGLTYKFVNIYPSVEK